MTQGPAQFLSRWSRLKRQGGEPAPVAAVPEGPMPVLPDPETLVFGDDFQAFLRKEVEEGVRRVALKKLFHSGQFNVMDGLDVYIDDYSLPDPIDEATIRTLNQAKEMLFGDQVEPPAAVTAEASEPAEPAETAETAAAGDVASTVEASAALTARQEETHEA